MFKIAYIILSAASVTMAANVCLADPLPEGSVKLTSAEARALYSGKSANWSKARAYFAPDGTFLIHGKDNTWFGEGRWTVSGNKVCSTTKWTEVKTGKTGNGKGDCWTWYKAPNKKLWDLWSGDKDKKNGWFDKEMSKFSKGDKITKTITKLKGKVDS